MSFYNDGFGIKQPKKVDISFINKQDLKCLSIFMKK